MKKLLKKLFRKNQPDYQPAGLIDAGRFSIKVNATIYDAFKHTDGTYRIFATSTNDARNVQLKDKPKNKFDALGAILEHSRMGK